MFSNELKTKMLVSIRLSRERRDWNTWAVDKAIALFVSKKKTCGQHHRRSCWRHIIFYGNKEM